MGRDTVPLAAWIAPVFLLRFARTVRGRYVALGGLALGLAWLFQFRGMVPLPFWAVLVSAIPTGVLGFLPYATDRWLRPRAAGFCVNPHISLRSRRMGVLLGFIQSLRKLVLLRLLPVWKPAAHAGLGCHGTLWNLISRNLARVCGQLGLGA